MIQGSERRRRAGYRVRIIYSEPGFRHKNPHLPAEYASVFEVPHALTADAAVAEAMKEWNYCIRHSGVGWVRVIKSVTVES
jgi:hypothetical protein